MKVLEGVRVVELASYLFVPPLEPSSPNGAPT
jgi:hypothetical protein